jgi:hypothetical protein
MVFAWLPPCSAHVLPTATHVQPGPAHHTTGHLTRGFPWYVDRVSHEAVCVQVCCAALYICTWHHRPPGWLIRVPSNLQGGSCGHRPAAALPASREQHCSLKRRTISFVLASVLWWRCRMLLCAGAWAVLAPLPPRQLDPDGQASMACQLSVLSQLLWECQWGGCRACCCSVQEGLGPLQLQEGSCSTVEAWCVVHDRIVGPIAVGHACGCCCFTCLEPARVAAVSSVKVSSVQYCWFGPGLRWLGITPELGNRQVVASETWVDPGSRPCAVSFLPMVCLSSS